MKKLILILVLMLAISIPALSQTMTRIDVFGGVALLHPIKDHDIPVNTEKCFTGAVGANFNHQVMGSQLGVMAEFTGYRRTNQTEEDYKITDTTYFILVGPRLTNHPHEKVDVFFKPLFGIAHTSLTPKVFDYDNVVWVTGDSATANSMAMSLGAGVDYKVSRMLSLRLAEIDYMLTRRGAVNYSFLKFGFGVVVRF